MSTLTPPPDGGAAAASRPWSVNDPGAAPCAGALDFALQIGRAQACLTLWLDEPLGTLHGLGLDDLLLLQTLADAGSASDGLTLAVLAQCLGLRPSALLRRLLPLAKTGPVAREPGRVRLRPAGRATLDAARQSADALCAQALRAVSAPARAQAAEALAALAPPPGAR